MGSTVLQWSWSQTYYWQKKAMHHGDSACSIAAENSTLKKQKVWSLILGHLSQEALESLLTLTVNLLLMLLTILPRETQTVEFVAT